MANKKINQLVAKTTIQSTDLFPIGDATTGTLYKKTIADLQAAIGGAVVSVNGLIGTVVLDTDDIAELATPTNKYFTDARARAAISLTTTGSSGASTYSSSTGVLNVPTYTLAGLGGITASFLSGGTGISYNSSTGVISYSGTVYTDSSVRGLFSAGTGITYNSSTGVITNSAVYSDSSIRALFSGTAPITYNSSTGAIGITQASGSTDGYLSATDWTTFNSKQSTLSGGTSGYATFWTGSSTLGADSAFFWDNTNKRLGIGSVTPDSALQVYFNSTTTTFTDIAHVGSGAGKSLFVSTNAYGFSLNDSASRAGWGITTDSDSGFMRFHYGASEKARITSSGQLLIGTTTAIRTVTVNGEIYAWNYYAQESAWTIGTSTSTASITGFGSTGYAGTTNVLALFTNGSERMRITSGGVALINTTSVVSNEKLTVKGSTNIWGVVRIENDTNQADVNHGTLHLVNTRTTYAVGNEASIMFSAYNSTGSMQPRATIGMQVASDLGGHLVFNTRNDSASGERMRITSAGNVLIATTSLDASSPTMQLAGSFMSSSTTINAAPTTASIIIDYQSSGNIGRIMAGSAASWNKNLALNPYGANVLIGTTTDNGERLYVSGAIRATGTITANSDITLKKNLTKIENALDKVEQINGYTYEFKADDSKRHAGVIAQEIQEVLPEIVNKGNDGILGVEYGNISALLIEAIKEQQAQINELKALLNK